MLIISLLIVPILGSLLISLVSETKIVSNSDHYNGVYILNRISLSNSNIIQYIALITSLINLLISLVILVQYNSDTVFFQFLAESLPKDNNFQILTSEYNGTSFYLGIDGLSIFFILLTTIITPVCILASWNEINHNQKFFFILFLILETLQIAVFVVLDLLLFYVFFESVLIPLFFIIGIWGASLERIRASFLFFLYTLWGSLFMLLSILIIYYYYGSTDLQFISLKEISLSSQIILWLGFFLSFAVKTPLVPFHLWLFRAHAEAPLAGSVILAAEYMVAYSINFVFFYTRFNIFNFLLK